MSELRRDSITGQWVLIAAERVGRPQDFDTVPVRRPASPCPFCRGHEEETPDPLAVYPVESDPSDWLVRVIPNRYPALLPLEPGADPRPHEAAGGNGARIPSPPGGLAEARAAHGVHEVIVESPRHVLGLAELAEPELHGAFLAYRDRLLAIREAGLPYGLVFKNCGPAAGATLEHVHSQVLGLPVIPDTVSRVLAAAEHNFQSGGGCLWCALIEAELAAEERLVEVTDHFAAFCPYASRFAYEVWILPRAHAACFEQAGPRVVAELAELARRTAERLGRTLNNPAYNYFLRTAPFDSSRHDHYHWHMEFFPRTTTPAGFEWATGCFINPVPPEQAAAALRGERAER